MFYFKYFIPIVDLHCWHYQHEGMSISLLHTAFIPKQESRQYKGKHLESNPKSCHSTVESMWCSKPHPPHTLKIKQPVQISRVIKKNLQTDTRDAFCCKVGKGVGTKLKRELNMPVPIWDAWQQLCCDVKGDKGCHSTILFFKLSSTVSRQCKPLWGGEETGPIFKCPATLSGSKIVQMERYTTPHGALFECGGHNAPHTALMLPLPRDDSHI